MIARPRILTALCVAAGLAGAPAFAAETATPADTSTTAGPAGGHAWQGGHWRHHGEFHRVLHQLNLTPEQKTQIKSIFAQAKTDYGSRGAAARSNHEALTAMSPSDAGYPTLLATEKTNAAARVQAMSDIKAQIYAVLTPAQLAQIPTIIATDKAARDARIATLRSQHTS